MIKKLITIILMISSTCTFIFSTKNNPIMSGSYQYHNSYPTLIHNDYDANEYYNPEISWPIKLNTATAISYRHIDKATETLKALTPYSDIKTPESKIRNLIPQGFRNEANNKITKLQELVYENQKPKDLSVYKATIFKTFLKYLRFVLLLNDTQENKLNDYIEIVNNGADRRDIYTITEEEKAILWKYLGFAF